MKSKAVIFGDGSDLKVIFGSAVKVIPLTDLLAEKNTKFLDRIFRNFSVYYVRQIVEASQEDIYTAAGNMRNQGPVTSVPPAMPREVLPSGSPAEEPGLREYARTAPSDQEYDENDWIRWIGDSTIIIDDILTNQTIPNAFDVNGHPQRKALVLAPNQPARLGEIGMDQVKKSSVLKSLLDSGRAEFLTPGEVEGANAQFLEELARQQQENDERLDQWAPIVENHEAAFANESSSSSIHEHDAETMEVTLDQDDEEEGPANESLSMASLMKMFDHNSSEGEVVELSNFPGEPEPSADREEARHKLSAARQQLRPEAKSKSKSIKRRGNQ